MTTPPMDSNPPGVKPVKAGPPRALLLGGAVLGLAGLAAAGFYFLSPKGEDVVEEAPAPPPPARQAPAPRPVQAAAPAVDPAVAAAKRQAQQALRAAGGRIQLDTSFDNVPPTLGGTGKRLYPPTPVPVADNGGKVKPIVQGRLPAGLRADPFVSRLIVPLPRDFAYTLAVPIRLAAPAKPPPIIQPDLPPDIRLGPLPYVPRRVAGFLEFGGVSAIVETGQFGTGDITIVQPGATVPSGIAGIPPLTVESISSTEMVLRAVDGRSSRVALSGIPGGPNIPAGAGAGGPPGGFPGGPPGGGRGGGGRGGGAAGIE